MERREDEKKWEEMHDSVWVVLSYLVFETHQNGHAHWDCGALCFFT
jgi:hypothetical protein